MWSCVWGKTPWNVNLNGILNDWNRISETKPQAHHLDASLGEEHEIDLFTVDIKPEVHAQTVNNTSQNPRGAALGRKLSSPLELGVTKDINKAIMVQLHTASTCNTLPDEIAQSLISMGRTK